MKTNKENDMELEIKHDQINHRFYADISGKICELKYKKVDNKLLDYYSTFVPEPLRDQGIAEKITHYAIEYALSHNYHISPSCSYVRKYLNEHPEYANIIKA